MMNKHAKILLSVFLVISLLLFLVPKNAFADMISNKQIYLNNYDHTNVQCNDDSEIETSETNSNNNVCSDETLNNGNNIRNTTNNSIETYVNPDETNCRLTIRNATFSFKYIKFAVWSEASSQQDLRWYNSIRYNNDYFCDVPIVNYGHAGVYTVHAYYVDASENEHLFSYTSFNISDISASIESDNINNSIGSFDIVLNNIVSKSSICSVDIQAWPKGSSNVLTFNGLIRSNSPLSYYAHVSMQFYQYHYGAYQFQATYKSNNGIIKTTSISEVEINSPNISPFVPTTDTDFQAENNNLKIVDKDLRNGTFKILMEGISLTEDITAVEFATWTKQNNQDDLVWHKATLIKNDDGTYNAGYVVDIAQHKNELGIYIVHAYFTSNSGAKTLMGYLEEDFSIKCGEYSVSLNNSETFVNLELTNTIVPYSFKVYFAVWSDVNGQDDLKYYEAKKQNESYQGSVNLLDFRQSGKFNAHVVVRNNYGTQTTLNGKTFDVTPSKSDFLKIDKHLDNWFFSVTLDNIVAPSGVYAVQFAVWSEPGGQDDIHWYNGTISKKDDGSFSSIAYVNLGNHGCYLGNYCIHAYVTAVNGARNLTCGATKYVDMDFGAFNAEISSNELYINTTISNAVLGGGSSIRLAVWSEKKGQDDLKWYKAVQNGRDYKYDVPILDHRDLGKYNIHVYVDYRGFSKLIFASTVNYQTKCTFDVECLNVDQNKGTFEISCYNVKSPCGTYKVQCPTWRSTSTSGTSVWYDANKSGDKYVAKANVADHEFYFGKYITHVYLTMVNGAQVVKDLDESISPKNYFGIKYYGGGFYKLCIDGFSIPNATAVKFPTWSVSGGQDDISWYNGTWEKPGRWVSQFSAKQHWPAGEFNTHVYAYSASKPAGELIAYKSYYVSKEATDISGNEQLDMIIKRIVRSHPTLGDCYNYVSYCFAYRNGNVWPGGEWTIPYAIEMATVGSGNCYRFAALFLWCARALGYQANAIAGQLQLTTGTGPHGWVEIYTGGGTYVCDPELQYTFRHLNFYMITYASAPVYYIK